MVLDFLMYQGLQFPGNLHRWWNGVVVSSHYRISIPDGLAVTLLQVLLSDRSFIWITSIPGSWTPSCPSFLHMSSPDFCSHYSSPHWSIMGTAVFINEAGWTDVGEGATCCMTSSLGSEQRHSNYSTLQYVVDDHSSYFTCPQVFASKSTLECIKPIVLIAEHEFLGALINSPTAWASLWLMHTHSWRAWAYNYYYETKTNGLIETLD